MGQSGRLSGGCGLPPQYWGGGEQQKPGQVSLLGPMHIMTYAVSMLLHSCTCAYFRAVAPSL